jgi:hypothetical protein
MQNQFFDLYRNGMITAAEVARTSLQNAARLQEKQLGMVRDILTESTRSAERLNEVKSIDELLALQSQIAGTQLGRIAEFWSTVWQSAAENQQSLFQQARSQSRSSEDVVRAAAAQISRAAGSVPESANTAQHERKQEQRKHG